MGMYDTITILSGLELVTKDEYYVTEVQTKDLDSVMNKYYIHEGQLYQRPEGNSIENAVDYQRGWESRTDEDGTILVETTVLYLPRVNITSYIRVYGRSDDAPPIIVLRSSYKGGVLDEVHVLHEWRLHIVNGSVEGVEPINPITRQEKITELIRDGVKVVPDDNPKALTI